jgi:hypothetical protein
MEQPTGSIPFPQSPKPKKIHRVLRGSDSDRFQIVQLRLNAGADINSLHEVEDKAPRSKSGSRLAGGHRTSREQVTALYDAARRGDYEAVEFLISRGADARVRNETGMGLSGGLFLFGRGGYGGSVQTLCGLDAMRTSRDRRIVVLAEEKFGLETQEEYVHRRDAFDTLTGFYPRHAKLGTYKPDIDRVQSVLHRESVQPNKEGKITTAAETKATEQQRYDLRPRKRDVPHKPRKRGPVFHYAWTDPRSGLRHIFYHDRISVH